MLERIFIRENSEYVYSNKSGKNKIGVMGLSPGSGTTFVALSLAKELSKNRKKRVAYVELEKSDAVEANPCIYDSLGMDKRFAGREFVDFYKSVREGIPIFKNINLDESINWALNIPESQKYSEYLAPEASEYPKNTMSEFLAVLNNIAGDIIIADLGSSREVEILSQLDSLICVIDPLPSRLLAGYEKLCHIKKWEKAGGRVKFILNKFNKGINQKDLKGCLKLKPDIILPNIEAEYIYSAEYNCQIPYSTSVISKLIDNEIKELAEFVTLL